jgi:hypothetical protein
MTKYIVIDYFVRKSGYCKTVFIVMKDVNDAELERILLKDVYDHVGNETYSITTERVNNISNYPDAKATIEEHGNYWLRTNTIFHPDHEEIHQQYGYYQTEYIESNMKVVDDEVTQILYSEGYDSELDTN